MRWARDERLFDFKFFKKEDRASQRNLTEDEIFDIRDHFISGAIRKGSSTTDDNTESERKVNRHLMELRELELVLYKRLMCMRESV